MKSVVFGFVLLASGMLVVACGSSAANLDRSPEYVEQPLGVAVDGRCNVAGDVHTVRHEIRVDRPGRLDIVAAVDKEDLGAELLLKRPDGLFVRQLITKPNQSLYRFSNVPAERGTWQLVMVCRHGDSSYTLEAHVRQDVAIDDY